MGYPSPGVYIDRRDQQRQLPTVEQRGDAVLIIGTAVDGPNDGLVPVTSPDEVTRIFGPTNQRTSLGDPEGKNGYNGNSLVRAYREALLGGASRVLLRRVGGSYATAQLDGYTFVSDVATISPASTVNLTYGNFISPNITASALVLTVASVSGNAVRLSGTTPLSGPSAYVDWFAYVSNKFIDSRMTDVTSQTLTLAEDYSAYIEAGDTLVLFPKGNVRVFDSAGLEFNPFNFILGPGSDSVAATIAMVASASIVTLDPRYPRATPSVDERVTVRYLMQPSHVFNLKSRTPSDIYNARGTYGTAGQDGCWVTLTQSLPTIGTLSLFVPKFRSSPVTLNQVPVAALKLELSDALTYDALVAAVNGDSRLQSSVKIDLADDATWNSLPVTIDGQTGGYRGITHAPAGRTALLTAIGTTSTLARFVGGTSGLNMGDDAFYNLLSGENSADDPGALEESLEAPAQYRVIAGVYADDTVKGVSGGWVRMLADHCYRASQVGYPCSGVIGVRPLSRNSVTPADVRTRVTNLTNPASGIGSLLGGGILTANGAGETVDVGAYVNIVAGPDGELRDADMQASYVSSLGAFYAGLLADLPLNRSTTQYPLPSSLIRLLYRYNTPQLDALSQGVGTSDEKGGAYTVFMNRLDGSGNRVYAGNTAARQRSQYVFQGTLRSVQAAETLVAQQARSFLGRPNQADVLQALESRCKAQLDRLAEYGVLRGSDGSGYTLSVTATGANRAIGEVIITMDLRVSSEIRIIRIPVTVTT